MKKLIIAEKPDQAKHYAEVFKNVIRKKGYFEIKDSKYFNGETAYITWCVGHLVELVEPEVYNQELKKWSIDKLPILPEEFKFCVSKGKKEQFDIIKKLLLEVSEVIIGTDSDREGENIAYCILKQAEALDKPIKRLWINSLEVEELERGFKNLRDGKETYNFYVEASTRQCSDWLVGMNLSRLYTVLFQQKGLEGTYSIGRVQTPTLYMIYKRIKEIENFKSKSFYEVYSNITLKNGEFKAKYSNKFDSKDEIQKLFKEKGINGEDQAIIDDIQKELKKQKSPKLHSLSTLQAKANKKWKYSPKLVLETMQSLYQKKFLSYPRTDCNYITENEFKYLIDNINAYQDVANKSFNIAFKEPQKRYVNNKEVQEHYAIIPTRTIPGADAIKSMTEQEKNIYFEILLTTLAMFAEDYEYEETKVYVAIKGLIFNATGRIEKNKGWKEIFEQDSSSEENETQTLPVMSKGEEGTSNIELHEGATKPPKIYTQGNLIEAMKNVGRVVEDEEEAKILKETKGIGTEATRAEVIETLKKQGYIEVTKNNVNITDKGKLICEAVENTLISSIEMTAKWEMKLREIGKGQENQEEFFDGIREYIKEQLSQAIRVVESENISRKIDEAKQSDVIGKCPICGGDIIKNSKAYSCCKWKEGCKFTIWQTIGGKKITDKQVKQLLEKGETELIKGFKNKESKTFDAKLTVADGKVVYKFENNNEGYGACPVCKKGTIVKNKFGYGCNKWREGCKFSISKQIAGKTITEGQVKKLIKDGKTDKIKGFKSKVGKDFDASLKLEGAQVKFSFSN